MTKNASGPIDYVGKYPIMSEQFLNNAGTIQFLNISGSEDQKQRLNEHIEVELDKMLTKIPELDNGTLQKFFIGFSGTPDDSINIFIGAISDELENRIESNGLEDLSDQELSKLATTAQNLADDTGNRLDDDNRALAGKLSTSISSLLQSDPFPQI